ncbi:MAG: Hsp33 family molecular chaperone HslO, partial [Verrucomicrobiota bacterium]
MSEPHSSPEEAPETPDPRDSTTLIDVRSYFVRERNALAVHASFERLYVDYYLHLMDQAVQYPPDLDLMLKDALAAVVLHATTRPWKETHAWTLNIPDPLANLFVTASSLGENVTGRVFTEGVRESDGGLFYAQVKVQNEEPRQSTTEIKGNGIFEAVEAFYQQSEQRRARIFELGDEEYFMISAQPDCDEEWLEALTTDAA